MKNQRSFKTKFDLHFNPLEVRHLKSFSNLVLTIDKYRLLSLSSICVSHLLAEMPWGGERRKKSEIVVNFFLEIARHVSINKCLIYACAFTIQSSGANANIRVVVIENFHIIRFFSSFSSLLAKRKKFVDYTLLNLSTEGKRKDEDHY